MKWRIQVRESPTARGAEVQTFYHENYKPMGEETILADASLEIRQNFLLKYTAESWLKRHPGVYVEMFGGVNLPARFRLVVFPSTGLVRDLYVFEGWNGFVLENIHVVGEVKEVIEIRSSLLC